MPWVGLMATIFAYGLLAKNREVLAMVAAGVSFRRLAVPAAVFGLALTAFLFCFNEFVVPEAETRAYYLEKIVIEGRNESIFTRRNDLFVKGDANRFYLMTEYLSATNEMVHPTILEVREDGAGLKERIEADGAQLVDDYWEFVGAQRWTFNAEGQVLTYDRFSGPYRLKMEEKLDKFLSKSKKPEEMNFPELLEYRDLLRRKGGEDIARYSTDLYRKLSFPVACLLMTLLGFTLVADVHARHFTRGVLAGIIIAGAFVVVDQFLRRMGIRSVIAPPLAAFTSTLLFALTVYLLMQRLERIRE
jgi:lipopolysaccharide export system permease protein